MNTTGCPLHYARDNMFSVGLDEANYPCIDFNVIFSVFAALMFMIAYIKTNLIVQNRKRNKQHFFSTNSWIALSLGFLPFNMW